jgi:phosphoglycerate dehydrogenase-like enzyme
MKVLFSAPNAFLSDPVRARYEVLETRFLEAWHADDLDDKHEELAWVTNPGQHFTVGDAVLDRFPRLEIVATPSTGTNHLDLDSCARRGLQVFSLLDDRTALEQISASAEFTFLMILNGLRRLDIGMHEAREGRWRSREDLLRGRELQGKTVGLVGFGRIGRKLAAYCHHFGCRVVYYDPYVPSPAQGDAVRVPDLRGVWETSDVIVICCQLNEETRGMIRGDLIERCRPGALIVNTSRGEIIDEGELGDVLRRREDIAFCADVVTGEVNDRHEDSPLMDLFHSRRIVLTPHIAGATKESQEKAAVITLRFLEREARRW